MRLCLRRPYPIVNIIADLPSGTVGAANALATSRITERARVARNADEMAESSNHRQIDLAKDNAVSQRLSTLSALAKHLRR